MGLIVALLTIAAGVGVALLVLLAAGLQRAEEESRGAGGFARANPDGIAASILFQIACLGGADVDAALAAVRRSGVIAPLTRGIEISSWAAEMRRIAGAERSAWLLEAAVQLAVHGGRMLPLTQYNALLDLAFGLGFQTDALARLRVRYPFDYVDHAKSGRPRSADRAGGAVRLFERTAVDREALLRTLELEPGASRESVISAYRKLAGRYHPDRYHDASAEEQRRAADLFIEITNAYERLLSLSDHD